MKATSKAFVFPNEILFLIVTNIAAMFNLAERLYGSIIPTKGNEGNNNHNSGKQPKNPKNIIGIILLCLALISAIIGVVKKTIIDENTPEPSKIDITVIMNFNDIHCEMVISEFRAEFWKFSKLNNASILADFDKKDQIILREKLWKIITDKRAMFEKIPYMKPVISEVKNRYGYEQYKIDFDNFMKLHSDKELAVFETEFVEYIREKQRELINSMKQLKASY